MTDDIVTRLRNRYCSHGNNYDGAWQPLEWPSSCNRCELDKQAADEIERLREQNEYLKANVEMLLAEARQSKYGIEDMYER